MFPAPREQTPCAEILQSQVQMCGRTSSLKIRKGFLVPGNYWKGIIISTDLGKVKNILVRPSGPKAERSAAHAKAAVCIQRKRLKQTACGAGEGEREKGKQMSF